MIDDQKKLILGGFDILGKILLDTTFYYTTWETFFLLKDKN